MADLAMGAHGLYVWTAYGLAIMAYAWLVFWPLYRLRRLFQQAHLLQHLTPKEIQKETQPEPNQPHISHIDGK